jgi:non-canonical (house-cleaning) NTP pyrophosphatase
MTHVAVGSTHPAKVEAVRRAFAELADAWAQVAGRAGIGQGAGTVCALTGGRIDRSRLYAETVIIAFARAGDGDERP